MPSRSSSSSTVDSLVARRTAPIDSRHEHSCVPVVQRLPGRRRVGDTGEQHEVRPALVGRVAQRGERRGDAIALRDDVVDHREHGRRVTQCRDSGGLSERAEVVGQADEAQGVDHGGVGREIPHPCAGERECLAHRARDDETLPAGQQRQRGPRVAGRELLIGLVDDHDAVGGVVHCFDDVEPEGGAGRIVRRAQEHDVGPGLRDLRGGVLRGERVVHPARAGHVRRAGRTGQQRIHRVGRGEPERGASRAGERLQQVLQHLVGAVGRPDLIGGETVTEVIGEALAQRGELAVRVAVDLAQRARDAVEDVVGDLFRDRMGVLVDVQRDRQRRLRRTVRRETAEVGTEEVLQRVGEVFETGAHPDHRRGRVSVRRCTPAGSRWSRRRRGCPTAGRSAA